MKTVIQRSEEHALEDVLKSAGAMMAELRVRKGFTSHLEFAEAHKLPRVQYWRMEKGKANITLKSLHKVASIHGLSIYDFFRMIHPDTMKSNGQGVLPHGTRQRVVE